MAIGMGFAAVSVGGVQEMGFLDFISMLAEPTLLAMLAIAAGMPLILLPGAGGMLLSVLLAISLLWFNYKLESSARRLPVQTGTEALRGRKVVVQDKLTPFGIVKLGPETWRAVEAQGRSVEPGEKAVVVRVQGLMLEVVAVQG